jgi:DNA polymerase-3 subunit gamma/tau
MVKSPERSLVGHAYLFSGPRGCGKTTAARLLAKALNCLSPDGGEPCGQCKNCLAIAAGESLDVIEIDGASNNGVDEVRELKTHVALAPFSSRYKVYIIDEVHMLSMAAFNALLKTLEEPPAYVVFILATTEAHKVPVTIRSRCQHIPFHRIGAREIYDRLTHVCSAEGFAASPDALWEIARQADGALRDALSMLEQVAGLGGEISLSGVEAGLGQVSRPAMERWLAGWREGGLSTFVELDRLLAGGASPQRFVEELFSLVRNLWLSARWSDAAGALDASEQEKEYLAREARLWDPKELESVMRFLTELMPQVRMGLRVDVLSGLLMAKVARLKDEKNAPPDEPPKIAPAPRAQTAPRGPDPRGQATQERPASVFPVPQRQEKAQEKVQIGEPEVSTGPTVPAGPAEPVKKLDDANWKPCPEERWSEALEAVHEKEFSLYCAIMDAAAFVDEERGALIIDVPERYCYEVLRLDRHRPRLKAALAAHDGEVILRHGERWVSCEERPAPASGKGTGKGTGKSAVKNSEKKSAGDEPEFMDPDPQPQRADGPDHRPGVPFSGLVQEVTRWLQGEVIMVRSGAEADSDGDEDGGVSAEKSDEKTLQDAE